MQNCAELQFTGIRVGGEEIRIWNDEHFKRLRTLHGYSDNFLETSVSLKNLRAGGGKGGSLMAFSSDRKLIVKEVSPGDHRALLDITPDLIDHLCAGQTLLCPIYLHFCVAETGKKFLAMGNMLDHPGPWVAKFDLKGCADDKTLEKDGRKLEAVHKRIWKVPMWIGQLTWSHARVIYFSGKKAARKLKIPVTNVQRQAISRRLKSDCEFLASRNLMDYSLIVGIRWVLTEELDRDPTLLQVLHSPEEELKQPLLREDRGGVGLLYLGVIDYLQLWGCGKTAAQCIKVAERNKATIPPVPYGRRFCEHFDRLFVAVATPVAQKLPRVGLSNVNGTNGGTELVLINEGVAPAGSQGSDQHCTNGTTPVFGANPEITQFPTEIKSDMSGIGAKETVKHVMATNPSSVKGILLSQGAVSTSSKVVNFSNNEGYSNSLPRPASLPALDDAAAIKQVLHSNYGPPGADGSGSADNLVLLDHAGPKQSCCCWLMSLGCKFMCLTCLLCFAWIFLAPHLAPKVELYPEIGLEAAHHKDRTFANSQAAQEQIYRRPPQQQQQKQQRNQSLKEQFNEQLNFKK